MEIDYDKFVADTLKEITHISRLEAVEATLEAIAEAVCVRTIQGLPIREFLHRDVAVRIDKSLADFADTSPVLGTDLKKLREKVWKMKDRGELPED